MPSGVAVNGARIREIREKRMLEQKEFAAMVGITPTAMYLIEVKTQRTRLTTLRKIARSLRVSPEALLATKASPAA